MIPQILNGKHIHPWIILTFGMRFIYELNISKEQYMKLKGLSCNKNIISQTADKGDSVISINRADNVKRMKQLLSETYLVSSINFLKQNKLYYYGFI